MFVFKNPIILLFLPLAIFFFLWWKRKEKPPGLLFPTTDALAALPTTWKNRLTPVPFLLRLLGLVFLIVALSGPRTVLEKAEYTTEGVDIMLAVDTSTSMLAEDFQLKGKRYNRLEIIKQVVDEFVESRPADRLGLIAFAGVAYTACPLTADHTWLKENLKRLDFGLIEDGTAIGSALSSSLLRLKQSEAKSKIVILLTDGVNNAGKVSPLDAAQAAKVMGVRVYTIGAGTKGFAPYPVTDLFGQKVYQQVQIDVDEDTLREIARITGGQFYRATDTESLRRIYQEIDKLEKTKFEETGYRQYKELFFYPLIAALVLLLMEFVLVHLILQRFP